ncbi:ABC transporter substrate-binding protein [Sphingobium sp. TCM1]|uniref:ABC transporter substrate-binding protein n=1 Tax=Sphingobium sp. TCM1 TaxID=453246 RepID=UPI0007F40642|nr:ABC transporter substrate-binding protein [Sphingobium sp. TCM1]OAN56542.1 hypothetical protein A7Q26_18315 [Sphingobium sp. TCM1]
MILPLFSRCAFAACATLFLMGASPPPPEPFVYLLPAPKEAIVFAPLLLADANGAYAREGLAVRFERVAGGGMKVGEALGGGKGDAGGALGDTAMILRARGIPVRGVALLGRHSFLTWMSVQGLAINAASLRGQAIGVPSQQDVSYYALEALLRQVGLTPDDVEVRVAVPDDLIAAMGRGELKAMIGTVDWGVKAERAGVVLDYQSLDAYYPALAQAVMAADGQIANRPKALQAFTHATLQSLHAIARDPAGAARRYVDLVPGSGYDKVEVERIFWLLSRFVYGVDAGKFDPRTMERAAKAASAEGLIPPRGKATDSFTNRFSRISHATR